MRKGRLTTLTYSRGESTARCLSAHHSTPAELPTFTPRRERGCAAQSGLAPPDAPRPAPPLDATAERGAPPPPRAATRRCARRFPQPGDTGAPPADRAAAPPSPRAAVLGLKSCSSGELEVEFEVLNFTSETRIPSRSFHCHLAQINRFKSHEPFRANAEPTPYYKQGL